MAAELEPDLILVAAAVKSALFFFEIVNVDPEFFAVVEHRCAGATLAGHAGEIIKRSDFFYRPRAIGDLADQSRRIALDPNVGLRVPKTNMFQGPAVLLCLTAIAVSREPLRRLNFEFGLRERLFRVDAEIDQLSAGDAQAQAVVAAGGAMRYRRRDQ